ncbi:hypothetical protein Aph01nite_71320 [Acrocarpospora phusangensis]|uniref:Uncharacterized protein n=1 Tax=Acrocarpospora phusangensis TaxID=1070424 RepID=A0A919QH36_9ACTN|nr:hypothetical protein [Acrocarpospora phusangensis]GIH28822.1 hypothetical protein Aph01nite_71320 [Acrocarpospora phusangensis]
MTRNRRCCPQCHTALDEGPILYRCARCQRAVYAADLDFDYTSANRTANRTAR